MPSTKDAMFHLMMSNYNMNTLIAADVVAHHEEMNLDRYLATIKWIAYTQSLTAEGMELLHRENKHALTKKLEDLSGMLLELSFSIRSHSEELEALIYEPLNEVFLALAEAIELSE